MVKASIITGSAFPVTTVVGDFDEWGSLTNLLSHGQLAASYAYDAVGNLQAMRYGIIRFQTSNKEIIWNASDLWALGAWAPTWRGG